MIALLLDSLIVLALISLAIQAISARALFRGIIYFVVFGLTMALAWARIGAPDLAMAEAAIGAGLTGALMMVAYRRLIEHREERPAMGSTGSASRLAIPIAVASGLLVGVIGLGALLAERRPAPDRLTEFYLLLSLGGVVGGAFTALLAPVTKPKHAPPPPPPITLRRRKAASGVAKERAAAKRVVKASAA